MKNMKILKLNESYIGQMAEIENACFASPWSADSFKSAFSAGHTSFFGAVYEDKLIAYAGLQHLYGEGAVTNVGVLPEYRRRGAGLAVMKALLEFAKEQKLEFVSLEVRESNLPAVSLYEHLGFERLGVRRGFYSSPKENAVIMQKQF